MIVALVTMIVNQLKLIISGVQELQNLKSFHEKLNRIGDPQQVSTPLAFSLFQHSPLARTCMAFLPILIRTKPSTLTSGLRAYIPLASWITKLVFPFVASGLSFRLVKLGSASSRTLDHSTKDWS